MRMHGVTERYSNLPHKSRTFFASAARHPLLSRARWLVKVDDDVYVIPRNLNAVLRRHTPAAGAEQRILLGLIKRGDIYRPDKSKGYGKKWVERSWGLLASSQYHQNCWGPAYAVSQAAAAQLGSFPGSALRYLSNEDTLMGLWSVAFGWDMVNELDLGRKRCREGAAVVYGLPHCAGLCHPEKEMPALHANSSCNLDS